METNGLGALVSAKSLHYVGLRLGNDLHAGNCYDQCYNDKKNEYASNSIHKLPLSVLNRSTRVILISHAT